MVDGRNHQAATREKIRRRLQRMEPDVFAALIADLWRIRGWDAKVVGDPTTDGIDILATKHGGETRIIQARRYRPTTHVRNPELQSYASLRLKQDVDGVTVVTMGKFTELAEQRAPALDTALVDGETLVQLVIDNATDALMAEYFEDLTTRRDREQERTEPGEESRGVLGWLSNLFR